MKTLIESFVHFLKEDLFDDETGWPLMNYDDETGKRMRVYDYGTEGLVKPSPRGDHPILKNALAGEMSSDPQREAGFLGPQNVRDDVLDHPWVASKPAAPKEDPANAPTKIVPPKAAASRNQQLLNMMFAKAAGMPEGPGLEKLMNKIEKFMIMMNK